VIVPASALLHEPGKAPRAVPVPPGPPVEILPSVRVSVAEAEGIVLEESPLRIRVGGRAIPGGVRWLLARGESAWVGEVRVESAWEDPGTATEARSLLLAALRGELRPAGPVLEVRAGPLAGRRLPAREGVLGRGPEAAVRLEDPALSRAHARLSLPRDGGLGVEDLGSRNGTWVGERRLRGRRALRPGEPFRAGRTVLALGLAPEGTGAPLPPLPPDRPRRRRLRGGRVVALVLGAAVAAAVAAAAL
jgi:hypothetical protein